MKWFIIKNSTSSILLAILTIQATLSLAEETKKRVIIKVPTRIKHIYHHHTKKVHIHKAKHVQPKPDVDVIIEEEVYPPYPPKWKGRSNKSRGKSNDWDEGYESGWKPQRYRPPVNWKGEHDDEDDYDNGPQASEDYYNYDENYRKGGQKTRHVSNNYREDPYYGPNHREHYNRRPRQPAESNHYSGPQSGQVKRKPKNRGSQPHKRQKYREGPSRPESSHKKYPKEALPEKKSHPYPPKSTRWSKPMSQSDYIEDDDFVPYGHGHVQNLAGGTSSYPTFKLPEIEKGFEPSGHSTLNVQTNSVIHPQTNPQFNYLAPQTAPTDPVSSYANQRQAQQQNHFIPTPRYPPDDELSHQVWTPAPSPTIQPSNVFFTHGTTSTTTKRPQKKNFPGYHNEIATDHQGETVGYQSHVGHNLDANHQASSFQSVIFGQRIKPGRRSSGISAVTARTN